MYLQDPHVYFQRHYPLAEDPISGHFHFFIFCIRIYLPLFLSNWLNFRFLPLIVYILIAICYVSAFCGIWMSLLLRSIENCLRLIFAFWLWLICWAYPHGPHYLGSGQTTTSKTNMSYYPHFDDYSFWWRASILTDNNKIISSTIWVGESLTFIQCNDFVSLNKRFLVCFFSLCGHHNTAFCQIYGSDKLECIACSLNSKLRNGKMAMLPPESTFPGEFKVMTK